MAGINRYVWGAGALAVALTAASTALADGPIRLRETGKVEGATRVLVGLKAEGLYRHAPPPNAAPASGTEKAEPPKPLPLRVETRLEFLERVVKVDADGRPARTVRRVVRAGSAVNVDRRPMTASLRPEVATLVADLRGKDVTVFSPGGALNRPELELVQGPADPLILPGLLPDRPVSNGEKWKVGDDAALGIAAYDTLGSNGLEARLESADDASAVVRIKGDVKGSALGGEGTVSCDGTYTFDRKEGHVVALTIERSEARSPGEVEAGLDVKSTLTLTRKPEAIPPDLADDRLKSTPQEPEAARLLLALESPDGKATLLHDRDWHLAADDRRSLVLKRLEKGKVVAQCNLSLGPNAGKGRHQELGTFREDIRRGLGTRFGQILGSGEVEGDPAGGFRYKVGIQGKQGDVGVVWAYYLIASPEGDQLLAIFTVAESLFEAFGEQDLALIRTVRWKSQVKDQGGR